MENSTRNDKIKLDRQAVNNHYRNQNQKDHQSKESFVKLFFANLPNSGRTYVTNLCECNESLEVLSKLVCTLLQDPIEEYKCKGCLVTPIVQKTLDIASKYDKKQQLNILKDNLDKLQSSIREEKHNYEDALIFKKKEIDFQRKGEDSLRFYETKANEYHKQIKSLESLLAEVGFNDNLKEESIESLVKENEQLQDSLKELNEKMSLFDFDPDQKSLEAAIERLQAEIDSGDF